MRLSGRRSGAERSEKDWAAPKRRLTVYRKRTEECARAERERGVEDGQAHLRGASPGLSRAGTKLPDHAGQDVRRAGGGHRPRRSRRSLAGTAVEDDADPDAVHWWTGRRRVRRVSPTSVPGGGASAAAVDGSRAIARSDDRQTAPAERAALARIDRAGLRAGRGRGLRGPGNAPGSDRARAARRRGRRLRAGPARRRRPRRRAARARSLPGAFPGPRRPRPRPARSPARSIRARAARSAGAVCRSSDLAIARDPSTAAAEAPPPGTLVGETRRTRRRPVHQ